MAKFEQYGEFPYDDLPLHTKYRFAEIELNQLYKLLNTTIFQFDPDRLQKSFNFIYQSLYLPSERYGEIEESLHTAFRSIQFRQPLKVEQINYFLFHKQTYKAIREITGASPNTIAKYRFQQLPEYFPVHQHWIPETLAKWNAIKEGFNLWKQPLAHTALERMN